MKIHEYQAKELFGQYGLPIPLGQQLDDINDLDNVINHLGVGVDEWVVKAQVYAGGRGKGGGVKRVKGKQALSDTVNAMLGSYLVTPQTDARGLPVNSVLIEQIQNISKEFYLAITLDRSQNCYTIIASEAGGMDIEEVASTTPEKIIRVPINTITGVSGFQCRDIAYALDLQGDAIKQFAKILVNMYRICCEKDASLVEVNPLAQLEQKDLLVLDAKVVIDDNALYRQKSLAEWHDTRQEDEKEMLALANELNYVALDGSIGCLVNGAGLAMATMDLIKVQGGDPANFLDVGGTATAERVAQAFKIILSDTKVKAILVNIFGGIVRCDLIAEGIIQAIEEVHIAIPVVVRLEGTHAEQGRVLLKNKLTNVIAADDLIDAAKKVVAATRDV